MIGAISGAEKQPEYEWSLGSWLQTWRRGEHLWRWKARFTLESLCADRLFVYGSEILPVDVGDMLRLEGIERMMVRWKSQKAEFQANN